MPKSRSWLTVLALSLVVACQGQARSCQAARAQNYGADWVVVQTDWEGYPYRCWMLEDTSIANEEGSDGIYWVDPHSKNLVHISGGYNRVQVVEGRWDDAFETLGITREICIEVQETIHHLDRDRDDDEGSDRER